MTCLAVIIEYRFSLWGISMPDISPFRALRYNPNIYPDLSKVASPPYDVISQVHREELSNRCEHNAVRITLPAAPSGDTECADKYTHAASLLEEWIRDDILIAEDRPALYVYDHQFELHGKTLTRRGICCLTRLEEFGENILPHEHTMAGPKIDRLRLMEACQAHLSPIFMLYKDPTRQIQDLIAQALPETPVACAEPKPGDRNAIYAIKDSEAIGQIAAALHERKFYIADGHHRYETYLNYAKARSRENPSPDAPFRFGFTFAAAAEDPGLVILPYHRMIKNIPHETIKSLPENLNRDFAVKAIPADTSANQIEDLLEASAKETPTFALISNSWILVASLTTSRDPSAGPRESLDVTTVEQLILKNLFGLNHDALDDDSHVTYTHEAEEAIGSVRSGECQVAVLMRPMPIEQLLDVAEAGEKMPRKSTFFSPKPWTGLLIHYFRHSS